MNTNHIKLSDHFSLHEFENHDGWCLIHPSVIDSLELVRRDLCLEFQANVCIIITCSTRSKHHNDNLAKVYGWTDEGGTVSRTSKHLPRYGGIAVDLIARCKGRRLPADAVGVIARRYFDYVKDDYTDGHIHADLRNQKP